MAKSEVILLMLGKKNLLCVVVGEMGFFDSRQESQYSISQNSIYPLKVNFAEFSCQESKVE